MAASETAICNLALLKVGHGLVDNIETGTDVDEEKCELLFDQARDELLAEGPEKGWKFTTTTYHGIDDDSATIASIANSSTSGDITITGTHALVVGDMVELAGDTGYDGTYDVTAISTTTTFDVTATFVATGTGTAHWRSEEYTYRYATPTSKKVIAVKVGGIELTDWVEQGAYVLTNMESDEVDITIVSALTSTVTSWPDHFVRALVFKLAAELALNLTQDIPMANKLTEEYYFKALPKAIAMDEKGKYVKESSNSWAEVGNTQEIE